MIIKPKVVIIAAVLLLPVLTADINESIKAHGGNTITVDDDGGADYTNIQEAIDAANPGDTVFVHNGSYYGNLIINKSIDLVGEDKNNTIINATGAGVVVNVTANYVNITGFNIQRSGSKWPNAGVYLASSFNTVYGNYFTHNSYCIKLVQSNKNKIFNNILTSSWGGVYLLNANENFVSTDNITDSNWGIVLDNSSRNNVTDNIINCRADGIYLMEYSDHDNLIIPVSSNNNIISGNKLIDSKASGIGITGRNNTVFKNEIINSTHGINICGDTSQHNLFTENMIMENDEGITIDNSSNNNTFYHNNLIDNNINANDSGNNIWYNPTLNRGNYWDDYQGEDKNGDDIGDVPYDVYGGNNQDKYPLMNSYQFPVSIKFKRFGVARVNAILKNVADHDLSNVHWLISIKGGLFNRVNSSAEGFMQSFDSYENEYIDSWGLSTRLIRNLGQISISINVTVDGETFTKSTNGFIVGRFVFVK